MLARNSSSLTAGPTDRRDHVRCQHADRVVIQSVECCDNEILNPGLNQRTEVSDRSIRRGVEDVVAPRALVALLDALGKVVGELGLEGSFVPGKNRPAGGVRPQDSAKRSADLLAVPVQNGQLVRHRLGTE